MVSTGSVVVNSMSVTGLSGEEQKKLERLADQLRNYFVKRGAENGKHCDSRDLRGTLERIPRVAVSPPGKRDLIIIAMGGPSLDIEHAEDGWRHRLQLLQTAADVHLLIVVVGPAGDSALQWLGDIDTNRRTGNRVSCVNLRNSSELAALKIGTPDSLLAEAEEWLDTTLAAA